MREADRCAGPEADPFLKSSVIDLVVPPDELSCDVLGSRVRDFAAYLGWHVPPETCEFVLSQLRQRRDCTAAFSGLQLQADVISMVRWCRCH